MEGIARDVWVVANARDLAGRLVVPPAPLGVVLFAHGSGSSRLSPRNLAVAETLHRARLATLLFDLLDADEEDDRSKVFDIPLLAGRLSAATEWARREPSIGALALGYFGASTGAAAALWAAGSTGSLVSAIVSRGGRPDLAAPMLAAVTAPTLLIVGGADEAVLASNREAAAQLRCEHRLEVIPDATHLFEEPGALASVARLATIWFVEHLSRASSR